MTSFIKFCFKELSDQKVMNIIKICHFSFFVNTPKGVSYIRPYFEALPMTSQKLCA